MSSESGTSGYTAQEDGTLLPDLDRDGSILNPNKIFEAGVLCDICQIVMSKAETVFCQRYPKEREIVAVPFHTTRADVKLSVGNGCHLCSIFLTAESNNLIRNVTPFEPPGHILNGEKSWATLDKYSDNEIEVRQFRCGAPIDGGVELYSRPDLWRSSQRSAEFRSASNASEETFRAASSWLKTCLEEHGHSFPSLTRAQLPKRLLFLGDQTDHNLRVVYPTTPPSYLTVSHCWGGKVNRTLSANTYTQLTTGFSEQWLPQLWRDCVTVTRRLGYSYLWIDSLCIQQDNARDKAEEILKMGGIYSGSVCNIAAVSAADSGASLFTKSMPLASIEAEVKKKSSSDSYLMVVSGAIPHAPTPLYGRAWVVQERVLAPRTLEYTLQGVRCCCPSAVLNKAPYLNTNTHTADVSAEWIELLESNSQQMSEHDKCQKQGLWMRIVGQYTSSALTRETDRKDALTGVITVLSDKTGLSFSIGVCKNLAPYSLLWRMYETRDLTCEPLYPDPSWSGTFRPAQSWSNLTLLLECSDLIGVKCSFDEQRSMVKFNARCSGDRVIRSKPGSDKIHWGGNAQVQSLSGAWSSLGTNFPNGPRHELFDKAYHDVVKVNIALDYRGFESREVEFALLTYTMPGPRGRQHLLAYGLVLARFPDDNDLWSRLGVFSLYTNKVLEDIVDPLGYMLAPWQNVKEFQVC